MVANNTFAVQVAQDTHDALEVAIQVGGVASIGITAAQILTQQGCALFVQYALQQIENTAVSIAIAQVSQNAISLAARFSNLNINPDYLRIGADAFQLFSLVEAAKAQNLASKSGCFSGTTLVDTTNHGEQEEDHIVLGERVDTSVSETPAQGGPAASESSTTAVDPATWRQVNLTMPDPNDSKDTYQIQLLETLSWITANSAGAGNWVGLDLPDMQISGEAQVQSIDPCPAIESGSGQVVLGTFEHFSNDVMDVDLVGQAQPLQVTSSHLLWSLDAGTWVAAGALYAGEHLAGANGPVVVSSVTADGQSMPVYNLDVENDHRYLVTGSDVLAHNSYLNSFGDSAEDSVEKAIDDPTAARSDLRKNLGITSSTEEGHQVLPVALLKDRDMVDFLNRAAEGGFHFNGEDNGEVVPAGHGWGDRSAPHNGYTNAVSEAIENILPEANTPEQAAYWARKIANDFRGEVEKY